MRLLRRRILALLCIAFCLCTCFQISAMNALATRPSTAATVTRHYQAVAVAKAPVYVAIGASDTVGYGVADPGTEGWVPRFAATLPAGTKLVNLGVVGITLHRALLVDLPVALDAHPRTVTVWLAVNDLLDGVPLVQYRADLHTLLQRLHSGTHARILVGNMPNLSLVPAASSRLGADPAGTLRAWNTAIAAETLAAKATLVDLYGGWPELAAHPEYLGSDGLHPSAAGYARLAEIFAAAL